MELQRYPEYGFSGYLANNQDLPVNQWYKINSWLTSPLKIWQYSENIQFNEAKSSIVITKSGIYFVSFDIGISSSSGTTVHASVIVNDDNASTGNKPIQSLSKLHYNESMTASGFVYVEIGDTLSLHIHSISEAKAAKQSALYVRYHDSYSALPGFLFSLSIPVNLNQNISKILGPWKNQHKGQFTSSSSFRPDLTSFQVPTTGVYMLCLNNIVNLNQPKQVVVRLLINSQVKTHFKKVYHSSSVFTQNFNDLMHLKSTDTVEIEVVAENGQLVIREETTFSMLLVKPGSMSANGFRGEIVKTYNITEVEAPHTLVKHWKPSVNRSIDFESFPESTIVDDTSFSIEQAAGRGVYYVSTNLVVTVNYDGTEDITGKVVEVSFYGSYVMQSKRIHVFNESVSRLNDGTLSFEFSINLIGSMLLSVPTPIGVGIAAEGSIIMFFHQQSSFSVLQSSEPYPGMHAALKSNVPQSSRDQVTPTGWISSSKEGFYDFTSSFNVTSGVYTAESEGVYLVTTNVVCEDVDNRLTMLISQDGSKSIQDGFYAKDSYPVQSMTLITGGFMTLQPGSNITLLVQAEGDEDWEIALGGFSVTYISSNPLYFQARLPDDLFVPKLNDVKKHVINTWKEYHGNGLLENKEKIILPYTGIYYTIGTIILDDAAHTASESYYKAHLKLNSTYVRGIYGKRKIGLQPVLPTGRKSYTLFFSGSFYGKKGSELFVELETGEDVGFMISQGSSWGIVYLREADDLSGCLADFRDDVNFRASPQIWHSLSFNFPSSSLPDGRYEKANKVSFDSSGIKMQSDGVYLISLNIEVEYTLPEKTLFKLRVVVNENEGDVNGMTIWQKSLWDSETLHITGAMFLNAGDKIEIKIKSDSIRDTILLAESGLSLVKVTEEDQSASFTGFINKDVIIGYEESPMKYLQFTGALRSTAVDLQVGTVNIPYSGFYLLSSNVVIENHAQADGVVIRLTVNGKPVKTYTRPIQSNATRAIQVQEILELSLNDETAMTLEPMYDASQTSQAYGAYLEHINGTASENITIANPYHALNLTIVAETTSMSLMYIPSFTELSGWWAELTADYEPLVVSNDYTIIAPWNVPSYPSSNGEAKMVIEKTGVYFLMVNIRIENFKETMEISFMVSDDVKCTAKFECSSNCSQLFIMNCASTFTVGENVGLYFKTPLSGATIMKPSTRAVNFLGASVAGFAMTSLTDLIMFDGRDWSSIGNWSVASTDHIHGLFSQDISIHHEDIVFRAGGSYEVSINLLLKVEGQATCSNCSDHVKGALFINGVMEKSLYRMITLDPNLKVITFNILGGLHVKKWDRIILKLGASSTNIKVALLPGSTLSVVLTEPASITQAVDKGPVTISKLEPASHSTHVMGIKKEWVFQAFADGPVTYTWYKNEQVYQVQNSSAGILSIAGYINDTGTYFCEADYLGIKVLSNPLAIDIYDINECDLDNDCSEFADCTNTPGSYQCTCKDGYSGNGIECRDTSACELNPCGLNTNCTDLTGPDYECNCLQGYVGDADKNCTDWDECHFVYGDNNCHKERADCINFKGGYNCSCHYEWSGNGSNGINCTDLNECEFGNNTCDANAECFNLNGTYGCLCNQGFTGTGHICSDINECLPPYEIQKTNITKCVLNAECVNEVGDYGCKCKAGFTGNGTMKCIDIDECHDKPCNADADCINVPGTYKCICRPGYTGDGFQCSDLDECETGLNSCGDHGNCSNNVGLYTCMCEIGYRLNAKTCEIDPAQQAAITDECIIDPKSFACLCRDPVKREDNIMCNGLFVALMILCAVALVVLFVLYKYVKSRKLMKIKPVRHHRDKYIEMDNETEI